MILRAATRSAADQSTRSSEAGGQPTAHTLRGALNATSRRRAITPRGPTPARPPLDQEPDNQHKSPRYRALDRPHSFMDDLVVLPIFRAVLMSIVDAWVLEGCSRADGQTRPWLDWMDLRRIGLAGSDPHRRHKPGRRSGIGDHDGHGTDRAAGHAERKAARPRGGRWASGPAHVPAVVGPDADGPRARV
jgi:hypothetical protein